LIWFLNIQAANAAGKRSDQGPAERTLTFESGAAYGILQFIMRHTYVLMATLGVCLLAAAQAAKQPPKAKPNVAAPHSAASLGRRDYEEDGPGHN